MTSLNLVLTSSTSKILLLERDYQTHHKKADAETPEIETMISASLRISSYCYKQCQDRVAKVVLIPMLALPS